MTRLVETATEAGANAVKVQLFYADHFPVAEQREKIQFEFPRYEFGWFLRLARAHGLQAGASVFDEEAVEICRRADFMKLAAREWGNTHVLVYARQFCDVWHRPLYRSIDWRLPIVPAIGHEQETLLACISEYPTPMNNAVQMAKAIPEGWGWSSHTAGYEDCIAAAKRGVPVIEKHLRLSADDPEGPWSLDGFDFGRMVKECNAF